ncbi:NAD(P)-dependent alcohol dehydrogenase [Nocardia sp. NPDC005978]|uniref:NAD(P)-dependent alcohol dehydrogenase n=1 Tax=Nocardia sp. NPDC005978 TaxID=3156725 RepID=UPI0033B7AD5E
MKAIIQCEYGTTAALSYADIPEPVAGPGQVLVRVRAAGLDPSVWHLMTGLPLIGRLALGVRRPRVPVRGWDLAGVVAAVGPGVTEFAPGDEVYGGADGAFAEFACTAAEKLLRKPANLSVEQAAALPISGMTALRGLRSVGRIAAGQRVLIIGAGGGVGHLAVQLAVHDGAHVTGVCSAAKRDFVAALGTERVIDYTSEKLTGVYDLVLDMAGNRPLSQLRELLTPTGTVVLGGGENGGRWFGGTERSMGAMLLSPLVKQRLCGLLSLPNPADLAAVGELAAAGAMVPRIDRTFALADAAAAIDYLTGSHPAGKVVLTVS